MDRRPPPPGERRVGFITGCLAGGGSPAEPPPGELGRAGPAVQPGWIAGRAPTGRTGPRGYRRFSRDGSPAEPSPGELGRAGYRRFSRDGSPLVSGAGRQHRVDPGAEGAGGGVTRPPSLLARERRVTLSTGCQVGGPGAAPASVRIRSEVRVRARGRASGAGRSREVSCGAPGSSSFRAGREAASGLRTCGL